MLFEAINRFWSFWGEILGLTPLLTKTPNPLNYLFTKCAPLRSILLSEFQKVPNLTLIIFEFLVKTESFPLFSVEQSTLPFSLHIIGSARCLNCPSSLSTRLANQSQSLLFPIHLANSIICASRILIIPQHTISIHNNYTMRVHNIIDKISNVFSNSQRAII